jgi:hypothetical protein
LSRDDSDPRSWRWDGYSLSSTVTDIHYMVGCPQYDDFVGGFHPLVVFSIVIEDGARKTLARKRGRRQHVAGAGGSRQR